MTRRNAKLTWMLIGIISAANLYSPAALSAHAGGHGNPEDYLMELKKDPIETLTGRILSLPCYLKHGDASLNYDRCTSSPLAQEYFSAALLTSEGKLYLLVMDHKDAFKAVREVLSKKVTARGRIVKKNGIEALVLRSIEEIVESKKK